MWQLKYTTYDVLNVFLKLFNIVNGSLISAIWRNTFFCLCSL